MKAEAALITINGEITLKALLIPENQQEQNFLREALSKAENYKLSAQLDEEKK